MIIITVIVGATAQSSSFEDSTPNPPMPFLPHGVCKPKLLGTNLDAPGHDLGQVNDTNSSDACAQACCANNLCGGALFEPLSAVTYGGCRKGLPCCFLKKAVADFAPAPKPVKGGSSLWQMVGRSQDDERLNFVHASLGSHMVLQRAPQQAIVWGHTAPGAVVTTSMSPSGSEADCLRNHAEEASKWAAAVAASSSSAHRLHDHCARRTYRATAGTDGTWRQLLPQTPASTVAYTFDIASSNSSAERASLTDVLFGDVYICGGQSNMEFAVPAVANTSAVRARAAAFPTIRVFTVGHRTSSATPLRDLQSVWEGWQVGGPHTIAEDYGPGHTLFSTFSAVCWLFGVSLAERLAPARVPLGLISANWGGTALDVWSPPTPYAECGLSPPPYAHGGPMYNAIIHPLAQGPMALTGFTFYQGEADTRDAASAARYSCLFPRTIVAWREAFGDAAARLWFGFVQLSTWCAQPPEAVPLMRDAQLAALALANVGYSTNADHGMGCIIHPAAKQYCARRLASAALAQAYGRAGVAWRSPTYAAAHPLPLQQQSSEGYARLVVALRDVGVAGLRLTRPANLASPGYGDDAPPIHVDCFGTYPLNATTNASMTQQCAWAALNVSGYGWLNASVSLGEGGRVMLLRAKLPTTTAADVYKHKYNATAQVLGSQYGWGPIPMLNVYDVASALPVLPWSRAL